MWIIYVHRYVFQSVVSGDCVQKQRLVQDIKKIVSQTSICAISTTALVKSFSQKLQTLEINSINLLTASALCMSVQMFAKALNVQLNLKKLSLPDLEHMTPEFLKLNPQHTIPTLVDIISVSGNLVLFSFTSLKSMGRRIRFTRKTRKLELWLTRDCTSTWGHFISAWEVRVLSSHFKIYLLKIISI